jgi:hypothetical protein
MNLNHLILIMSLCSTFIAGWGGKQIYTAYTKDAKTTKKKIIAIILSGLSGGALSAMTLTAYQAIGPTIYTFSNEGRTIQQGEARFTVAWDPSGLNDTTKIEWGNVIVGITYNRTIYIINRSDRPLNIVFTCANPSWNTTDPEKDLTTEFICATTPLGPNRFRSVDIKLTCLRWLIPEGQTSENFYFDIILTGTLTDL